MEWRVELHLRPGRAELEQNVTLYNRSPVRRRFYWWNNAAVRVKDDTRISYPMRFTASHGFRDVDTWPVNHAGVDLSVVGNHRYGPVSLFAHGSRETFMGVWHPVLAVGCRPLFLSHRRSHQEDLVLGERRRWPGLAPGALRRRERLRGGPGRPLPQPGDLRLPRARGVDPLPRVLAARSGHRGHHPRQPEGVLYLARSGTETDETDLTVGVNLSQALHGGRLQVRDGRRLVGEVALDLTPSGAFIQTWKALPAAPRYTITVADSRGQPVVEQTEGAYDMSPDSEIHTGPQPVDVFPPPEKRSEGDLLELGAEEELKGRLLVARDTYEGGLSRFAGSTPLEKAAGRLAVTLQRYDEGVSRLSGVIDRVSNDAEARYYRGLALAATGEDAKARDDWDKAQTFRSFRPSALLELARLDARSGDLDAALRRIGQIVEGSPDASRAGEIEVTLLRHAGRAEDARGRLAHWLELAPTSSYLRHEAVLLGGPDERLWRHLAGDPERVLNLVDELIGLGQYDDALRLLERRYPAERESAEPGNPLPQDDPLVAYYRGFCREKAGGDPRPDFEAASRMSTRYVFPNRASTGPVLRRALELRPSDATAHFLYGSLLLAGGRADEATREWQEARRLDGRIPVLHRDLGLTLLRASHDAKSALAVFREGMDVDGGNVALYMGADEAHSVLGDPPAERIETLERFPDRASMPPDLVYKLALALAEAGRGEEAEQLFQGRFFPREEGGTNVRQVFLEVRLRRALSLARSGRENEAVRIADDLLHPVQGLAFTRDGLDTFLRARLQYLVGEVRADGGRETEARRSWSQAAEGKDISFLGPVYALLARRKLGTADEAEGRRQLESNLAESEAFLQKGTQFPGIVEYAQGLTLRLLGREDEARARLRDVFRLADKRLSHFLARRALDAGDPI